MMAIQTKYSGATNARGSRIRAWTYTQSLMVPYNYELTDRQNHEECAMALAEQMRWVGPWIGGELRHGYAFVCLAGGAMRIVE